MDGNIDYKEKARKKRKRNLIAKSLREDKAYSMKVKERRDRYNRKREKTRVNKILKGDSYD
jgi:hypothetical protein